MARMAAWGLGVMQRDSCRAARALQIIAVEGINLTACTWSARLRNVCG